MFDLNFWIGAAVGAGLTLFLWFLNRKPSKPQLEPQNLILRDLKSDMELKLYNVGNLTIRNCVIGDKPVAD